MFLFFAVYTIKSNKNALMHNAHMNKTKMSIFEKKDILRTYERNKKTKTRNRTIHTSELVGAWLGYFVKWCVV